MKAAEEKAMMLRANCFMKIHYHPTWQDATRLAIFVNSESLETLLSCIGPIKYMWSSAENDLFKFNKEVEVELEKYLNTEE